jgi:hypothetical protein
MIVSNPGELFDHSYRYSLLLNMINFISKIRLLILVSTIAAFSSCGPSKSVSFNITQPAEISLPPDVNTILLVDRTKFDNSVLNTVEGILTGEMPGEDKAAAEEGLNSLKNKLENSPRYNVRIHNERLKGNSMTSSFPNPLPWNVIDQLCVKNNAELVVALEVFDSNFIVTNGSRIQKRTEGSGKDAHEVPYTEYYAQGVGSVKMGIRTYYNKEKRIVDQQMLDEKNTWEGTGSTPLAAAGVLISKSKANKYLASSIGNDYAYKISPMPVRISRQFYKKAKDIPEVETGVRYADVNKWEEAVNTWKSAINKAKPKEAGKIAYNIAVGYEVLGDYGSALTWAQDAYTKYGNKEARQYSNVLQNRINDERLLREQMKN